MHDDREKRFTVSMAAGMVMLAAATLLTGPLAITAAVTGSTLLGVATFQPEQLVPE